MAEYRSGNSAKADELLTAVVEYDPEGKQIGNTAMFFVAWPVITSAATTKLGPT